MLLMFKQIPPEEYTSKVKPGLRQGFNLRSQARLSACWQALFSKNSVVFRTI